MLLLMIFAAPVSAGEATGAAALSGSTNAERRRMDILQDERRVVETELIGVVNRFAKASPEEKIELQNQVRMLQRNIKDLDTEIASTGKMPEIVMKGDEGSDDGKSRRVNFNGKEGTGKEEVKQSGKPRASWDVFGNF
jgi:hypothetical protein